MNVAFTQVTPDEDGQMLLSINGRHYSVEQDDDGYFLCEILPIESLPDHIRQIVERPVDPTKLVRRRVG